MKLGILSDTHGYLPAAIHSAFAGVDAILHAGDIGHDDIIIELETIAPVTAVRGNMDRTGRAAASHDIRTMTLQNVKIVIVHDIGSPYRIKPHLKQLLKTYAPHVFIFGHTHVPYAQFHRDIFYFNPGSVSRDRSGKGNSAGLLEVNEAHIISTHVFLNEE